MEHEKSAILSYDPRATDRFDEVLSHAGYYMPQRSEKLGVAALSRYSPSVLMVDFDHLRSDPLESIRQVRFVLPDCAIAVVSSDLRRNWAKRCHLAGASAVLSSLGTMSGMVEGLQYGVRNGCYTDPGFSAEG